ncbi:hypothetical protein ACFWGI_32335 [Streptomyces niveus]|uniref:hypothetical protein n=1 Tax=Streptomyces niveus TaxID=193462 RepID=UPI003654AA2A
MPVLTAPPVSTRPGPAGDRRLVEQAVVDGALAAQPPETLVRTDVPQPDGAVRLYAAWTDGGGPLADNIDRVALARGLDACSWMEILQRNARTTHRGRIEVRFHPCGGSSPTSSTATGVTSNSGPASPGYWPTTPPGLAAHRCPRPASPPGSVSAPCCGTGFREAGKSSSGTG